MKLQVESEARGRQSLGSKINRLTNEFLLLSTCCVHRDTEEARTGMPEPQQAFREKNVGDQPLEGRDHHTCLVCGYMSSAWNNTWIKKKKGIQVMKCKKIRMQKVSRKQRHWFELSSQSMPRRGKFPKHTHPCVWSHAIPSSSWTCTPCFFFLSTKCIQYFKPPLAFSPSYFP